MGEAIASCMEEGGQNFLKVGSLGSRAFKQVREWERERENECLGRFLGISSRDLVFPRPTSYMLASVSFFWYEIIMQIILNGSIVFFEVLNLNWLFLKWKSLMLKKCEFWNGVW
jgi:hypothetical protein